MRRLEAKCRRPGGMILHRFSRDACGDTRMMPLLSLPWFCSFAAPISACQRQQSLWVQQGITVARAILGTRLLGQDGCAQCVPACTAGKFLADADIRSRFVLISAMATPSSGSAGWLCLGVPDVPFFPFLRHGDGEAVGQRSGLTNPTSYGSNTIPKHLHQFTFSSWKSVCLRSRLGKAVSQRIGLQIQLGQSGAIGMLFIPEW
jgi:hypothetical protein